MIFFNFVRNRMRIKGDITIFTFATESALPWKDQGLEGRGAYRLRYGARKTRNPGKPGRRKPGAPYTFFIDFPEVVHNYAYLL